MRFKFMLWCACINLAQKFGYKRWPRFFNSVIGATHLSNAVVLTLSFLMMTLTLMLFYIKIGGGLQSATVALQFTDIQIFGIISSSMLTIVIAMMLIAYVHTVLDHLENHSILLVMATLLGIALLLMFAWVYISTVAQVGVSTDGNAAITIYMSALFWLISKLCFAPVDRAISHFKAALLPNLRRS